MATLIVAKGPASGQQFALGRNRLLMIGRDSNCSIQILDDRLSRRHFQIQFVEDKNLHYLNDFKSKHGVLVNGTLATGQVPLADGDAIEAGSSVFVFTTEDTPDAQALIDALRKRGQAWERTQP